MHLPTKSWIAGAGIRAESCSAVADQAPPGSPLSLLEAARARASFAEGLGDFDTSKHVAYNPVAWERSRSNLS